MQILITRPQPAAADFATRLESLGHEPILSPVLKISCTDTPLPSPPLFCGIIITSRNALLCLEKTSDLSESHDLPLFAVGQATADLAGQLGFTNIFQGNGQASDLVALIANECDLNRKPQLIHPGGSKKAFDLAQALAAHGVALQEMTVYEAKSSENLSRTAIQAIKSSSLDCVTLMSPRTARHFHALVKMNRLGDQMRSIPCLCLSENVAVALKNMPCREKVIASRPDLDALLELIEQGCQNNQGLPDQ